MKKNKSGSFYSIDSMKKVVEELGYDLQDLEDIEVVGEEDQKDVCRGTCVTCQSGCETNS